MNEPLGHRKDCPSYKATAQNEPTDEEIRKELLENPKLGEGDDKDVFTKCARHFYRKGQQDLKNSKDVAEWQLEYLEELKENGWKSPEEIKKLESRSFFLERNNKLEKKIAELEEKLTAQTEKYATMMRAVHDGRAKCAKKEE